MADLDALCAWMRSNGATSARVGDVALTLGPPVAALTTSAQDSASPPDESPEAVERREIEALLYSSGADPEPFLRRGRAA